MDESEIQTHKIADPILKGNRFELYGRKGL